MDDPNSSRPAKYVSMFIMLIIALSVVNFIVGTEVTPRCAWLSLGAAPDEVAYECGRTLHRSMTAITLLLTFVITLITIFATLIFQFEAGEWREHADQPGWGTYDRADGKPSPFVSIFHAFYWVLVTMTTVGYGDIYPITVMGWLVAGLAMMSGLIVLTLPITIIGANFDEESREQQRINERRRRADKRKAHAEVGASGSSGVLAHNVPGFDDAAELVRDHKVNVGKEMEGMMGKLEKDLTESLIKVILQSRVTKRKGEPMPPPPPSPSRSSRRSWPSARAHGSARSEAQASGSEAGRGAGSEEGAARKT